VSARSIRRRIQRDRRQAARRLTRTAALGGALLVGSGALAATDAAAATFQVINDNDSGAGSLRKAILDSDSDSVSDTITFAASVGGRIEVGGSPLPSINDPVQIEGPGADELTVDGNGAGTVFRIRDVGSPYQEVGISGLTITGGSAYAGGGIYDGELLSLYPAELTITDCVVTGNKATHSGGGVYIDDGGSLTVNDSTISANEALDENGNGGGISVTTTDGAKAVEVKVTGSTVRGNSTAGYGGGVFLEPESGIAIATSTIAGNRARKDGAGIYVRDENGSISSLSVGSSTISGNVSSGENARGGGLQLEGLIGPTTITNSTISGNTAENGGGIFDLDVRYGPVTIANSTIAGNEATGASGGIDRQTRSGTPLMKLRSTIVGSNVAPVAPDLGGDRFELSHSLISDTSGATVVTASPPGSNRLNVPAQLGPLTDNGGPTLTMLPALASPAIDAGLANGLTTDQRGLDRTVDGSPANFAGSDGTDIGAVERDIALEGAKVKAKKKQKQKGKKIVIKVKAGADEDVTVDATGKVKLGKKKLKLKPVTKQVDAGRTATLKLKPKGKKTSKKIAKALDTGKKQKASLKVTLTDAAGNAEVEKPMVTLKR
jgi:hypothetical protein